MNVKFYIFRALSPEVQLHYVLTRGTFLANRWDEENGGANLYHLPDEGRGFFVEIGFDDDQARFVVLRSFSSPGPLEEYAQRVQLPGA